MSRARAKTRESSFEGYNFATCARNSMFP